MYDNQSEATINLIAVRFGNPIVPLLFATYAIFGTFSQNMLKFLWYYISF